MNLVGRSAPMMPPQGMNRITLRELDVVAPNLKRRLSGVTATIVRLVPVQARSIAIARTGPGLPAEVPHIALWKLFFLPRDRWRIWHARRNNEMLLGLALRHIFRRRLRLVFTSASQRNHSRYTKWLIRRMERVVATSAKSASYLDGPATVIRHGIDTVAFAPTDDKAGLKARLGLDASANYVGCFGRIRGQKGTDVFVHAMIRALGDARGWSALVMGRATQMHGAFLDKLKGEVADAGLGDRIRFLPEVDVDRIADWYRALDLFIAPQRWEGFGLTPLEAMAAAVPVFATDVGAFGELVVPGETGTILPPGDVSAMAEAFGEAVADPAKLAAWGAAGRDRAGAEFDIRSEARALNRLYSELLDR